MKKTVRFISAILTVLMILSSIVIVNAADPAVEDYLTTPFATEEAKLKTMSLKYSTEDYELYCDEYTGEIALKKIKTGQVLFSNPYDVGSIGASEEVKYELLSQLIVHYKTVAGEEKDPMNSFNDAVLEGNGTQVQVENIRNGIRVEYTIGRQEARLLLPAMIRKDRFEELILNNIVDPTNPGQATFDKNKLLTIYHLYDPFDESLGERQIAEMQAKYPITNRMAIYVCETSQFEASNRAEAERMEAIVKKYCPDYTLETLDEDHAITEYEGGADVAPPLFRLALEYTIDEDGLEVRLPANGIRYDDTAYILQYIDVLPYMGAISSDNPGYTFIPDGSGALIEADKLAGVRWNRSCSMYGYNFAYQQLMDSVTNPQEDTRFPVWGAVTDLGEMTVQNVVTPETTTTDPETGEEVTVPAVTEDVKIKNEKGFVAYITEGESLASIQYTSGGGVHNYSYVYARLEPRPFDTYNLQESRAEASNATWTVVSPRKYVESYRIKYVMLDGSDIAERAGLTDYYPTTYYGMAEAYRDYLEKAGILTRLTEEDVSENMPLYIETLGTMMTSERFLSIPVTVDTPLTTFDNIKTMYEQLSEAGIDNVNFKLMGFANGGLSDPTVPYNLKWEKAVGGESGFRDLLEYAKDKNLGIYPDFDFAYAPGDKWFDGFSYKEHAVKTIDDRYTSKRYYDATSQNFTRNFEIAISPSVFEYFYDHFAEIYGKYEANGISVSTLGSDLNSDFDEDDPYNREDSKKLTADLLEKIADKYDVMVDAGNAFTYKYVDHIVNMTFESSRFFNASYSVPFNGIVLHGYVNIAGTPLNEEGDVESALLRCIESGSALNFIFAYQNVEELKQDHFLNKYYSIRYDIWFDDLVEYYNTVNDVLKDLQTSLITGHEFLEGERIPDADEMRADNEAAIDAKKREEELAKLLAEQEAAAQRLKDRMEREALEKEIADAVADTADMIEKINGYLETATAKRDEFNEALEELAALKPQIDEAKAPLDAALAAVADAEAALEEAEAALEAAEEALDESEEEDTSELEAAVDTAEAAVEAAEEALSAAEEAAAEPQKAFDAVVTETGYNTVYSSAERAARAVANAAKSAAGLVESAAHKVEITADQDNAAEVAANAATVTSVGDSVKAIGDAVEAAVNTTLASYSLDKADEPATGEGTEPGTGEGTEPGTGEGTEPGTGEGTEPGTGEGTEPGTGEGTEPPVEPVEEVSKYAVTDGSIVLVTYENGTRFILNYNGFAVKVVVDGKSYTVGSYNFVKIEK